MPMTDRHRIRASWHDYCDGIYFVTIRCGDKGHHLGEISDGEMSLSPVGMIVDQCIADISVHSGSVEVLNYVVMPNHVHFIVDIHKSEGDESQNPDLGCLRQSDHGEGCVDFHFNSELSKAVRLFKAACTRLVRRLPGYEGIELWQRNYHEHIIRDQHAFDNIMLYIDTNVMNWGYDRFHPSPSADAPWKHRPQNPDKG